MNIFGGRYRAADKNDFMTNTSKLLDSLLAPENYDRQIRPGFGAYFQMQVSVMDQQTYRFAEIKYDDYSNTLSPPTVVLTDIEIRSFGSISETDMLFSMDCYFRQTWFDQRLQFRSGNLTVLSMDWKFLQRVWTPDTYFLNGKGSYLHKVSAPNKFVRVRYDGQLKYSMRLTIQTNCPMHLRKYPLDKQACPLIIGSFAYTARDVLYEWKWPHPVAVANDVTLSQYDYLNITLSNRTEGTSSLLARFILRRRRGYFILQIYAPCAMIVGASWVSFWINKSDAPGRVAVGATTVLTLVTMGFGGRSSLPRVAYATAIDWFVILCFSFVFAAMVEYACVNVVDRNDLLKLQRALKQQQECDNAQAAEAHKENGEDLTIITEHCDYENQRRRNCSRKFRPFRWKKKKRFREETYQTENKWKPDRGSRIDAYARVLFPCAFGMFNILYWTLYLYTIDDEIPDTITF